MRATLQHDGSILLADDREERVIRQSHPGYAKIFDLYQRQSSHISLAVTHAPKGYTHEHPLRIAGEEFFGGQFIPPSVEAKATPQELQQLAKPGPAAVNVARSAHSATPQKAVGYQTHEAMPQFTPEPGYGGFPWKGGTPEYGGRVYAIPTNDIHLNPERFQFKIQGIDKKTGTTAELKGTRRWNPIAGGVIAVWKDPADGKTYAVNGHHRREMAGRFGVPTMNAMYIDAPNATEARAQGALLNMMEGRGTSVDAAKFLRDSGKTVDDLKDYGVSLKGKVVADAIVLRNLSDGIFGQLVRDQMDTDTALAIGRHLSDHNLQNYLADYLAKESAERGKTYASKAIESMAQEIAELPTQASGENLLFGESEESLFGLKNELKTHVRQELSKVASAFEKGASEAFAGMIGSVDVGNVLKTEENKTIAEDTRRTLNTFDTLVNRKGAISDALTNGAKAFADAKGRKAKNEIKSKLVWAVREAIKREQEGPGAAVGVPGPSGLGESSEGSEADVREVAGEAADGGRGLAAPEPDGLTEAAPGMTLEATAKDDKSEEMSPEERRATLQAASFKTVEDVNRRLDQIQDRRGYGELRAAEDNGEGRRIGQLEALQSALRDRRDDILHTMTIAQLKKLPVKNLTSSGTADRIALEIKARENGFDNLESAQESESSAKKQAAPAGAWESLSVNEKIEESGLDDKVLAHPEFQSLKSAVDAAWKRSQGKPEFSQNPSDYLTQTVAKGQDEIQKKIALETGVSLEKDPRFNRWRMDIPKPGKIVETKKPVDEMGRVAAERFDSRTQEASNKLKDIFANLDKDSHDTIHAKIESALSDLSGLEVAEVARERGIVISPQASLVDDAISEIIKKASLQKHHNIMDIPEPGKATEAKKSVDDHQKISDMVKSGISREDAEKFVRGEVPTSNQANRFNIGDDVKYRPIRGEPVVGKITHIERDSLTGEERHRLNTGHQGILAESLEGVGQDKPMEPEKSKGHIAFVGNHEYFRNDRGQLFKVSVGKPIGKSGNRTGETMTSEGAMLKHQEQDRASAEVPPRAVPQEKITPSEEGKAPEGSLPNKLLASWEIDPSKVEEHRLENADYIVTGRATPPDKKWMADYAVLTANREYRNVLAAISEVKRRNLAHADADIPGDAPSARYMEPLKAQAAAIREKILGDAKPSGAPSSDQVPSQKPEELRGMEQMYKDNIALKKSKNEKVPPEWERGLSDVRARLAEADPDKTIMTDADVYGHPQYGLNRPGHENLVPIRVDKDTDLSWRLDDVQKQIDALQAKMSLAYYKANAYKGKSGATPSEQKAAKAYVESHAYDEDTRQLEDLRETHKHLGDLQRQQKEKFGTSPDELSREEAHAKAYQEGIDHLAKNSGQSHPSLRDSVADDGRAVGKSPQQIYDDLVTAGVTPEDASGHVRNARGPGDDGVFKNFESQGEELRRLGIRDDAPSESVSESLRKAGEAVHARKADFKKKLDQLPDESVIKSHGKVYIAETIDGERFWRRETKGAKYRGHISSYDMNEEVGGRAIEDAVSAHEKAQLLSPDELEAKLPSATPDIHKRAGDMGRREGELLKDGFIGSSFVGRRDKVEEAMKARNPLREGTATYDEWAKEFRRAMGIEPTDYAHAITIAADDIGSLRKADVRRVLESMQTNEDVTGMSGYIIENRPDLRDEATDAAFEISNERKVADHIDAAKPLAPENMTVQGADKTLLKHGPTIETVKPLTVGELSNWQSHLEKLLKKLTSRDDDRDAKTKKEVERQVKILHDEQMKRLPSSAKQKKLLSTEYVDPLKLTPENVGRVWTAMRKEIMESDSSISQSLAGSLAAARILNGARDRAGQYVADIDRRVKAGEYISEDDDALYMKAGEMRRWLYDKMVNLSGYRPGVAQVDEHPMANVPFGDAAPADDAGAGDAGKLPTDKPTISEIDSAHLVGSWSPNSIKILTGDAGRVPPELVVSTRGSIGKAHAAIGRALAEMDDKLDDASKKVVNYDKIKKAYDIVGRAIAYHDAQAERGTPELAAKSEEPGDIFSPEAERIRQEALGIPASDDEAINETLAQRLRTLTGEAGEPAKDEPVTNPHLLLAEHLADRLRKGEQITARELFDAADRHHGGSRAEGKYGQSEAYDSLETGFNMSLRGQTDPTADLDDAIAQAERIADKVDQLPTQTNRTGKKESFQQFSTPPHYAFAINWLANPTENDLILEPSAGTGCLTVHAQNAGAKVIANELDEGRVAHLEHQLGKENVHNENAEHIGAILRQHGSDMPSLVVMNPPFSQTAGRMGDKKDLMTGANHITEALSALQPNGRLVAIVGGGTRRDDDSRGAGMSPDSPTYRKWFADLAKKGYTLRANVGVGGDEYKKYGTHFGTRTLIIDKIPDDGTKEVVTGNADDIPDLMRKLEEVRNDRPIVETSEAAERTPSEQIGGSLYPPDEATEASDEAGAVGPSVGMAGEPADEGISGERQLPGGRSTGGAPSGQPLATGSGSSVGKRPRGAGKGIGSSPTASGAIDGESSGSPLPIDEGAAASGRGGAGVGGQPGGPLEPTVSASVGIAGAGLRPPERLTFLPYRPTAVPASDLDEPASNSDMGASLYEPYRPQLLNVKGAVQHDTPLVESAAMSAVMPPAPTYRPVLSPDVVEKKTVEVDWMDGTKKKRTLGLSEHAVEAVVYAGQAHEQFLEPNEDGVQHRRGYFIGDGTGSGKGREIAGVISDNWNQGRKKHVWLSKSADLINAAKRDWVDLGGHHSQVIPFKSLDAVNKPEDGVVFLTYATLRDRPEDATKPDNVDALAKWLGPDFDGVIAADESHECGNAIDSEEGLFGKKKSSQQAMAFIKLQKMLPKARVLYVSATGATEVKNLAYCERLGIWGKGTPFPTKKHFVSQMQNGGTAAMEAVAQSLKATGGYTSRAISQNDGTGLDGPTHSVSIQPVVHHLTDEQRYNYDAACEAWQQVLANIDKAVESATGESRANGKVKAMFMSRFWGQQQRFYNQFMTSMQTPSVIAEMEKDKAEGRAPVIALVNTMKASLDRAIAKKSDEEDYDNLDVSPKEILSNYLKESFPVGRWEEETDEDGNVTLVPVMTVKRNDDGTPMIGLDGKRIMVQVEDPEAVRLRDEMIEKVDLLKIPQSPMDMILNHFGHHNVAEISGRNYRIAPNDDGKLDKEKRGKHTNSVERDNFMDGKKFAAIVSAAGLTGLDYHADKGVNNQNRRRMYLLQPGWRADNAVQALGRVNRTNQSSFPIYSTVQIAELNGQKRFISTIARRLEQLGALTKGQRQTGGGGIFTAADNLESEQAEQAMDHFFADLAVGKVEGLDHKDVMKQLGLYSESDEKKGKEVRDGPRSMSQFLNRILCLKLDTQNKVFDAYDRYLQQTVEHALQHGEMDTGVENFKAQRIDKKSDNTVYKDAASGAEVKHLVTTSHKTATKRKWEANERQVSEVEGLPLQYVKNTRSGNVYAVYKALDYTDPKTGNVIPQYRLRGISRGVLVPQSDLLAYKNKYEEIEDPQDARAEWEREYDATPKTEESEEHFLVGAFLPIWDKIPGDKPKIYRIRTSDGKTVVGRYVPRVQVPDMLRNLGVSQSGQSGTIEGPRQIHQKLQNNKIVAHLANGWKLKPAMLQGQRHIELIGPTAFHMSELQSDGVMKIKVGSEVRLFVPTGDHGAQVMERITKARPVVKIDDIGAQLSAASAGFSDDVYRETVRALREMFPLRWYDK